VLHVLSLTGFGILALRICYYTGLLDFIDWTLVLVLAAALLTILAWMLPFVGAPPSVGRWWGKWALINISQAVFLFIARWIHNYHELSVPYIGWSLSVTSLVPVFLVLLVLDFYHQLRILCDGAIPVRQQAA
jgi:hypothetical protein